MKEQISVPFEIDTDGEKCGKECQGLDGYGDCSIFGWCLKKDTDNKSIRCGKCLEATK